MSLEHENILDIVPSFALTDAPADTPTDPHDCQGSEEIIADLRNQLEQRDRRILELEDKLNKQRNQTKCKQRDIKKLKDELEQGRSHMGTHNKYACDLPLVDDEIEKLKELLNNYKFIIDTQKATLRALTLS